MGYGPGMAELEVSKEGSGLFLGLLAVAVAAGADVATAQARVEAMFAGAEGMKLRMKGVFTASELGDLARRATGAY